MSFGYWDWRKLLLKHNNRRRMKAKARELLCGKKHCCTCEHFVFECEKENVPDFYARLYDTHLMKNDTLKVLEKGGRLF